MRVKEAEAYASRASVEGEGRNPSWAVSGAEVRSATDGETKPEAAQVLLEAVLERSNMIAPTSGWWRTKERRESMGSRFWS